MHRFEPKVRRQRQDLNLERLAATVNSYELRDRPNTGLWDAGKHVGGVI